MAKNNIITLSDFLQSWLMQLNQHSVCYAILRNYEQFPLKVGRDLDVLVSPKDSCEIDKLMTMLIKNSGLKLHKVFSPGKQAYIVIFPDNEPLRIDVQFDFRYCDIIYGKADRMLARRTWNKRGFFTLNEIDEAVMLSLTSLLSRKNVKISYREKIESCAKKDSRAFRDAFGNVIPGKLGRSMASSICASSWNDFESMRFSLVNHLRKSYLTAVWAEILYRSRGVVKAMYRQIFRQGSFIVLVGPHGSGKTTTAELLSKKLSYKDIPTRYSHITSRSGLLPKLNRKTRRHFKKDRVCYSESRNIPKSFCIKSVRSTWKTIIHDLRLFYHVCDYFFHYLVVIRPFTSERRVFISDRYYYDYLVEPRGVSASHYCLRKAWAKMLPRPDLVVLLENSPEEIHARKPELSISEIEWQLEQFRKAAIYFPSFIVLDTRGTPEQVVSQLSEHLGRLLDARTEKCAL